MTSPFRLGPITATDPGARVRPDALLQASRRVDWRFLLPDPDLGRVAYIGPAQGTLLKSLRLFSASLTIMKVGERVDDCASPAQHEVVVVSDPTAAALQRAIELLEPGGWLYMEAYGPFSRRGLWGRSRRLRFARDYAAALRQLGMDDVEVYWHWPNFESCTRIIPLGDQTGLLNVLAQHHGGAGAKLLSVLGRLLRRSRLLMLVVPCFSMVAHRRAVRLSPG